METYGAAAHFNVPHIWCDLNGTRSRLTPVVVNPVHEIHERVRSASEQQLQQHRQRRAQRFRLRQLLHQEVRRNLFSSALLIAAAAPQRCWRCWGNFFRSLSVVGWRNCAIATIRSRSASCN